MRRHHDGRLDGAGVARGGGPTGTWPALSIALDAGPTAADSCRAFLRLYTRSNLIDWLTNDQGQLTALPVVQEVAPAPGLPDAHHGARLRKSGREGWVLREGRSCSKTARGWT